ncbi:hypothetical protein GH714_020023 [Hevea brasiliensis]|uniref:Uncharacterized protein n=1 Tax=Hevea brasiliensis TaxID=3981 RepID=A0A6A6K820_HEVBR|nr:hypothetical protein GH714_020023 [Hevea brasiliensis]
MEDNTTGKSSHLLQRRFRSADDEVESEGVARMREAAGKSFEVSKMTAEESAAEVVGEAVDKVKDKLSNDDEKFRHHDEL